MMPGGEIMAVGDGNTGDGEEEDLSMDVGLFYTILEEELRASPGEPVPDTGNGGNWHLQSDDRRGRWRG